MNLSSRRRIFVVIVRVLAARPDRLHDICCRDDQQREAKEGQPRRRGERRTDDHQAAHGSYQRKPQSSPWTAIDDADCPGERGIFLVEMALYFRQDLLFTIAQRHGPILLVSFDDSPDQHSRRLLRDWLRTDSRQDTVHSVYESSAVS